MNYINKIKIGETTYDISAKCGDGMEISENGTLELNLGNGLTINQDTKQCEVKVGDNLLLTDNGINFPIGSGLIKQDNNGIGLNLGYGLEIDGINNSKVNVKIGSGLTLNQDTNQIYIQTEANHFIITENNIIKCKLGTCLIDSGNGIGLNPAEMGNGIHINPNTSHLEIKLGNGLKFDNNGAICLGTQE